MGPTSQTQPWCSPAVYDKTFCWTSWYNGQNCQRSGSRSQNRQNPGQKWAWFLLSEPIIAKISAIFWSWFDDGPSLGLSECLKFQMELHPIRQQFAYRAPPGPAMPSRFHCFGRKMLQNENQFKWRGLLLYKKWKLGTERNLRPAKVCGSVFIFVDDQVFQ